jgi:hypothetical protein
VVGERCCLSNNYLKESKINNEIDNNFGLARALGKTIAFAS